MRPERGRRHSPCKATEALLGSQLQTWLRMPVASCFSLLTDVGCVQNAVSECPQKWPSTKKRKESVAAYPSFFAPLWDRMVAGAEVAVGMVSTGEILRDFAHTPQSAWINFLPHLCTCVTTTYPPLISLSPPPTGQESPLVPHSFLGFPHLCTYLTIFFSLTIPLSSYELLEAETLSVLFAAVSLESTMVPGTQ